MNELNNIDPDWAWRPFNPNDSNPWDHRLAAHLYRRAGFGADLKTLDAALTLAPVELVGRLVSQNTEPTEFRSVADSLAQTVLAGGDSMKLSAAWVYRMMFSPSQLLEKTTLFWHGHFATGAEKVKNAELMWRQNQLLRSHALGDVGALTEEISSDPAMLIYLDSASNRKAHPNENFARELMELFCLGEGHYTERDVQELARCFTGWEIRRDRFRKNRYQHDNSIKSILGQEGDFDGEDGVRIVLSQDELPRFLCRKWFRFFVCDEPSPPDTLIQPLANTLVDNDLQVAPVLRQIFASSLFFSDHSVGRKIKSPVELVVGLLRCLGATANSQMIAGGLRDVGQGLFYPPNVKGWDGGRAWINSSTLLGRANLVNRILSDSNTKFGGSSMTQYLDRVGAKEMEGALHHFETCFLARPLTLETRRRLIGAANEFGGEPESAYRGLLHSLASMPEFQLA